MIPTLAQHTVETSGQIAVDLLVLLATAGLVATLGRRVRMASIAGYLIAGTLIGPSALGFVTESESTGAIRNLATILLMFTIGMHLDVRGLRGGLVSMALAATASTVLIGVVGAPVVRLFGVSTPAAIAVALAMSMSSTAVVLRVLDLRRELHSTRGRLVFGILVFQDMLTLGILAALPLLEVWARGGEAGVDGVMSSPLQRLGAASLAIGGIAVLIVVGRWIVPRLLLEAARDPSNEVLLVVSAAIALGAAVFSAWLGFSPELGAFLAGFLLAGTPFRYQLAGQLTPIRDLFMAVFFTAVGLQLPLGTVAADWWLVLIGVAVTVAGKALITGGVVWAAGASAAVAAYAGVALAQGGEFSLVILTEAHATRGILSETAYAHSIAVVVVSLMITPMLLEGARWASERARAWPAAPWIRAAALAAEPPPPHPLPEEPDSELTPAPAAPRPPPGPPRGRAIVAGFGPVGRAVADALDRRGVSVTIIELNPRTVRKQTRLGRSIVFGDASNAEVLESAGIGRADAVILTMPDEESTLQACRVVRGLRPDVFVAARANVLSKALQAMQLGADHVVVEELAAAEAMAAQVMAKLEQRAAGEDTGPKLYQFPELGRAR